MTRKELASRLEILAAGVVHPDTIDYGAADVADELERLLNEVDAIYESGEEW